MTDKHINTCEFLNICQTNCNGTLEDTEMCHCYELYKQLEHKNKELQEAMDNYVRLDLQRVKEYNELVDLYKAKEQECEELKKQVEIFTRQLEKTNKEVIKEKEKNATQRQKKEKLKQTLIEIKEICKAESYLSPQSTRLLAHNILQKVSECEVGE